MYHTDMLKRQCFSFRFCSGKSLVGLDTKTTRLGLRKDHVLTLATQRQFENVAQMLKRFLKQWSLAR